MATTLTFKDLIDLPEWRPLFRKRTPTGSGQSLCCDLRNNAEADPYIYNLADTNTIERYHKLNDAWSSISIGGTLGGTLGPGSGMVHVPSKGPSGSVSGTRTTTSFQLSALPNSASVSINQLANKGDGLGYKIRIYGKTIGRTEEKYIIANSAGTNPVIVLDSVLTFTPSVGDIYEILSGSLLLFGAGITADGFIKCFDIATMTSSDISITNFSPTISTDFSYVMLDERLISSSSTPGESLVRGGQTYNNSTLNCIRANSSTATTMTSSGLTSAVLANEYANFNIQVVEATANQACVGQRRKIVSHTAGTAPVFTITPAFTTIPGGNSEFIITNNNDLVVWTNGSTTTYSKAVGGFSADTSWSNSSVAGGAACQYPVTLATPGPGCCVAASYPIILDTAKNARHSHILWFRGSNTNDLYQLDIATLSWSSVPSYGGKSTVLFGEGTVCIQDPSSNITLNQGRYLYIQANGTEEFFRFDLLTRTLEPFCNLMWGSGPNHVGNRLAIGTFIDGTTKLSFLYCLRTGSEEFFNVAIQR